MGHQAEDQAFSLLPARPCCPGQQESTTTHTNRTRFRERSESRFLFPSNYSCCRHTELDSCNNPMVGTFFTLLGLLKGHFDVGLTVFQCHIFILDLKLCHGFILCDSRCTFFGLEHTQPYIFCSEVFYFLLLHLPSYIFCLPVSSIPMILYKRYFVF